MSLIYPSTVQINEATVTLPPTRHLCRLLSRLTSSLSLLAAAAEAEGSDDEAEDESLNTGSNGAPKACRDSGGGGGAARRHYFGLAVSLQMAWKLAAGLESLVTVHIRAELVPRRDAKRRSYDDKAATDYDVIFTPAHSQHRLMLSSSPFLLVGYSPHAACISPLALNAAVADAVRAHYNATRSPSGTSRGMNHPAPIPVPDLQNLFTSHPAMEGIVVEIVLGAPHELPDNQDARPGHSGCGVDATAGSTDPYDADDMASPGDSEVPGQDPQREYFWGYYLDLNANTDPFLLPPPSLHLHTGTPECNTRAECPKGAGQLPPLWPRGVLIGRRYLVVMARAVRRAVIAHRARTLAARLEQARSRLLALIFELYYPPQDSRRLPPEDGAGAGSDEHSSTRPAVPAVSLQSVEEDRRLGCLLGNRPALQHWMLCTETLWGIECDSTDYPNSSLAGQSNDQSRGDGPRIALGWARAELKRARDNNNSELCETGIRTGCDDDALCVRRLIRQLRRRALRRLRREIGIPSLQPSTPGFARAEDEHMGWEEQRARPLQPEATSSDEDAQNDETATRTSHDDGSEEGDANDYCRGDADINNEASSPRRAALVPAVVVAHSTNRRSSNFRDNTRAFYNSLGYFLTQTILSNPVCSFASLLRHTTLLFKTYTINHSRHIDTSAASGPVLTTQRCRCDVVPRTDYSCPSSPNSATNLYSSSDNNNNSNHHHNYDNDRKSCSPDPPLCPHAADCMGNVDVVLFIREEDSREGPGADAALDSRYAMPAFSPATDGDDAVNSKPVVVADTPERASPVAIDRTDEEANRGCCGANSYSDPSTSSKNEEDGRLEDIYNGDTVPAGRDICGAVRAVWAGWRLWCTISSHLCSNGTFFDQFNHYNNSQDSPRRGSKSNIVVPYEHQWPRASSGTLDAHYFWDGGADAANEGWRWEEAPFSRPHHISPRLDAHLRPGESSHPKTSESNACYVPFYDDGDGTRPACGRANSIARTAAVDSAADAEKNEKATRDYYQELLARLLLLQGCQQRTHWGLHYGVFDSRAHISSHNDIGNHASEHPFSLPLVPARGRSSRTVPPRGHAQFEDEHRYGLDAEGAAGGMDLHHAIAPVLAEDAEAGADGSCVRDIELVLPLTLLSVTVGAVVLRYKLSPSDGVRSISSPETADGAPLGSDELLALLQRWRTMNLRAEWRPGVESHDEARDAVGAVTFPCLTAALTRMGVSGEVRRDSDAETERRLLTKIYHRMKLCLAQEPALHLLLFSRDTPRGERFLTGLRLTRGARLEAQDWAPGGSCPMTYDARFIPGSASAPREQQGEGGSVAAGSSPLSHSSFFVSHSPPLTLLRAALYFRCPLVLLVDLDRTLVDNSTLLVQSFPRLKYTEIAYPVGPSGEEHPGDEGQGAADAMRRELIALRPGVLRFLRLLASLQIRLILVTKARRRRVAAILDTLLDPDGSLFPRPRRITQGAAERRSSGSPANDAERPFEYPPRFSPLGPNIMAAEDISLSVEHYANGGVRKRISRVHQFVRQQRAYWEEPASSAEQGYRCGEYSLDRDALGAAFDDYVRCAEAGGGGSLPRGTQATIVLDDNPGDWHEDDLSHVVYVPCFTLGGSWSQNISQEAARWGPDGIMMLHIAQRYMKAVLAARAALAADASQSTPYHPLAAPPPAWDQQGASGVSGDTDNAIQHGHRTNSAQGRDGRNGIASKMIQKGQVLVAPATFVDLPCELTPESSANSSVESDAEEQSRDYIACAGAAGQPQIIELDETHTLHPLIDDGYHSAFATEDVEDVTPL